MSDDGLAEHTDYREDNSDSDSKSTLEGVAFVEWLVPLWSIAIAEFHGFFSHRTSLSQNWVREVSIPPHKRLHSGFTVGV